ncbi:hypothetical protein C1H46_013233 [Malus baccata]|uniref:Pectinesterase inhibitor domain-containing protein n=1 Tax=Malus baccata TaxID=106549 RepID=A0A540MSC7_MALBA|nr:hypothetical protein C1H46_013233 [Malus baccata]
MSTSVTTFLLLVTISVSTTSCLQQSTPIQLALDRVLQATTLVVQNSIQLHELVGSDDISNYSGVALRDCTELYDESAARLTVLLSKNESYTGNDARTWLSGVLANHRSCLDGLDEKGFVRTEHQRVVAQNLTMVLGEALVFYGKVMNEGKNSQRHGWECIGSSHFERHGLELRLSATMVLDSINGIDFRPHRSC